ncbi:MAG: F0F1 ATP synthase subunit A [Actinobacteria bacterium]|nr:MAG: F0F1 ATP synthase subunit A [Actinomycetota bacterium]
MDHGASEAAHAVPAIQLYMPYIVLFNFALVGVVLVSLGRFLLKDGLAEEPGRRQNVAEFALDFFVGKAEEMRGCECIKTVAPLLATLFGMIWLSNLLAILPIPIVNKPPTAFYSGPLALALCAIGGTLYVSGAFNGIVGAVKHLFWPNPLQLITEVSDVMSLSLRLYGNIGGEYMVAMLIMSVAPFGIPLVIHALGMIPMFVQPLVFTLLTTSFIAGAIKHERKHAEEEAAEPAEVEPETELEAV